MITKATVATLRTIWPSIRDEFLERSWRQTVDALCTAKSPDQIAALQGRAQAIKGMMNLPDQLATFIEGSPDG